MENPWIGFVPFYNKDCRELPGPLAHVRTQTEDSHLWTRNGGLSTKHWTCLHLEFRFPGSGTVRNRCPLFLHHPVNGTVTAA